MKLRLIMLFLLLTVIVVTSCSYLQQIQQQQIIAGPDFTPFDGLRTTVAVVPFVNKSDVDTKNLGSAIADMLISSLVRSGRFVVLEREQLEQIIHEQVLGQTGVITEETTTEVGHLLGVQTLIIGEILEVEQETSLRTLGDEEDKKPWSIDLKATVGHVNYAFKLIDTATGEIIASEHVSATEFRPGIGVKTKEVDFEDTYELDQTILGLASRKAINKIAKLIVATASNISWQGKIVKVNNDEAIYFTPGHSTGVTIGDYFSVLRNVSDIPDSSVTMEEIATIQVIQLLGDKVAISKLIDGLPVEVGDRVRSKQ